mmetsp:Transcript_28972/g.56264  ORF Transcript_28972/g.56264 Transcript_28972/m.56264 type:complete len:96 (-) Transcript_28972:318-605(-)
MAREILQQGGVDIEEPDRLPPLNLADQTGLVAAEEEVMGDDKTKVAGVVLHGQSRDTLRISLEFQFMVPMRLLLPRLHRAEQKCTDSCLLVLKAM